jgi:hypothetical protein
MYDILSLNPKISANFHLTFSNLVIDYYWEEKQVGFINKCLLSILVAIVVMFNLLILSFQPAYLRPCIPLYCEYWLPYLIPIIGIITLVTLWRCVPQRIDEQDNHHDE